MALLSDSLCVWEISFRWANKNPRRWWLSIPLDVQDHFRNIMSAILSAELPCESITLEKRKFDADEREFSVYFWLDDIYACMFGHKFNRKLLRHASIDRYDFHLWCERRSIPLPDFWFPAGWRLEYELPDDEIHPGHYYIRKDWTSEQWADFFEARKNGTEDTSPDSLLGDTAPTESGASSEALPDGAEAIDKREDAINKLRPNQEIAIACRQIAKVMWKDDPNRFYPSIINDELIQKYAGAAPYEEATIREWIKAVAPHNIRNHRGRPPKKGAEGE